MSPSQAMLSSFFWGYVPPQPDACPWRSWGHRVVALHNSMASWIKGRSPGVCRQALIPGRAPGLFPSFSLSGQGDVVYCESLFWPLPLNQHASGDPTRSWCPWQHGFQDHLHTQTPSTTLRSEEISRWIVESFPQTLNFFSLWFTWTSLSDMLSNHIRKCVHCCF